MGGGRQIRSPLPPAIRPRRQLVLSLSLLVLVLYVEQALGFEGEVHLHVARVSFVPENGRDSVPLAVAP